MFGRSKVFGGFSVDDLDEARRFYGETLGLDVDDAEGLLWIRVPDGGQVVIYPKEDHQPATYTTLNIPVTSIDEAVAYLEGRGVVLIRYDGYPQDEKGVMREYGPPIAWIHDPAGNILSVIEIPDWAA